MNSFLSFVEKIFFLVVFFSEFGGVRYPTLVLSWNFQNLEKVGAFRYNLELLTLTNGMGTF